MMTPSQTEASEIWPSITRMHKLGSVIAFLVGTFGCVLLMGTFYLNRMEQFNEMDAIIQPQGLDPLIAHGMKNKLSFTIFPGVVMIFLSLVIRMARPEIPSSQEEATLPEDHLTMSKIQRQCSTLIERVNLTRLLTNVFAVVSVSPPCPSLILMINRSVHLLIRTRHLPLHTVADLENVHFSS